MLYALTYSGIILQISPQGTIRRAGNRNILGQLRGISHHPWRSHKPEYTLEDIYASPELLTRAYLLVTQELPVWIQSKVKAGWLDPTPDAFDAYADKLVADWVERTSGPPADGTYIPGEFLHTMGSD